MLILLSRRVFSQLYNSYFLATQNSTAFAYFAVSGTPPSSTANAVESTSSSRGGVK